MQEVTQEVPVTPDELAQFLAGTGGACAVVDVGHVRARDLGLELPPVPLDAIMPNDVWERVYDRMAELVAQYTPSKAKPSLLPLVATTPRLRGDADGGCRQFQGL